VRFDWLVIFMVRIAKNLLIFKLTLKITAPHEISNLYRGPSIDASYQALVHPV
jgi:hypothetical protein